MIPRIAIPIPTTTDIPYNQRSWPQYAEAVRRSGGEPVAIDIALPTEALLEQAATCDGVLLPGSPADVDPALYGEGRNPATDPSDPARERADYLLLEDAERNGKPVLGVCYGVQSLNVWRGGGLVQDLLPVPVNHAAGGKVAVAHSVLVYRGSLLGSLIDPSEATEEGEYLRLPVNSSHHQAVPSHRTAIGRDLRAVACCPEDGVVEAVELSASGQFLLGVQWHPERSYEISATSRALFARLVAEAGPKDGREGR